MTPENLLETKLIVIDVRSPSEYAEGHIPNAINIPLFSNEEREVIGTIYKNEGKKAAIEKGLEFVNLSSLAKKFSEFNLKEIVIYCARGGMRSASVGWLLNLLGCQVFILEGGYKLFRQWVLLQFSKNYPIKIIGGYTGVRKTALIRLLVQKNQGVDLEGLAKHKGSAFGGFDHQQPSQEYFENLLAISLFYLKDENEIFIEDESRNIGRLIIPSNFYDQMKKAPLILLKDNLNSRIARCVEEYSFYSKEQLKCSIKKIEKKLGSLATYKACAFLDENNYIECCKLLLFYYDKKYAFSLLKREQKNIQTRDIEKKSIIEIIHLIEIGFNDTG